MEYTHPSESEQVFLKLAYNRFYDIFEEIFKDNFWNETPNYRLSKIKDAFSVYSELINYEPLKYILEEMKTKRPPMEAEIGKELFKFIRNVVSHFPFFDSWDEIWINKTLVNWSKPDQTIDKFINKNLESGIIKYRFWEESKKKMTYLSINYPSKYNDEKIYIKNIISEFEGVKFSMILMNKILSTQVEEIRENG
jgi:hypothetical protein